MSAIVPPPGGPCEHFAPYAPAAHPGRTRNSNLSTTFAGCAFVMLAIAVLGLIASAVFH